MAETICITKEEYLKLKKENQMLRQTKLYARLLQFEKNIKSGKIFTRKDIGF